MYNEPKMSTYPCYIPPQTPAYTFDALTFSPGFFYETLMHPATRSGSPHNALHSSSYAICCKSTNHQLQCLHSLSADYLFHVIDHTAEKYPISQEIRSVWMEAQTNCSCLYNDTAGLLLQFPKASITIFSVDVWMYERWNYQSSSRCEKDISLLWRNHNSCGLLAHCLNSCVLPTEGLDSSWFSTSQHVTGQSISSESTSFVICTISLGCH